MNKYFKLNSYCNFIREKNNSCLYNLVTGDMISIDIMNVEMLSNSEDNIPLDKIHNLNMDFYKQLYDMQMGKFYEKPVYIEKMHKGLTPLLKTVIKENINIKNLFIELGIECNLDCKFCIKDDNTLFRKTGCKRWKVSNVKLDINQWKQIVSQAYKLGCTAISFIGGEPFLYIDDIKEIIKYAKLLGINNFVIYTNGTILNDDIVNFILKYSIDLKIQILSSNEINYEKICGIEGIYKKILNNLKTITAKSVNYSLVFLINRLNENEVEDVISYYTSYTKNINIEYIYPKPNNEFFSLKYSNLIYNKKKQFIKPKLDEFSYLKDNHNCYGNQIAITCNGDVLPCIMSRNLSLGNLIHNEKLAHTLNNSNYEYLKHLNKDKIDKCKECSYRFGCLDCRAIEMSASKKINGLEYCDMS